jgi:hypothetical protein
MFEFVIEVSVEIQKNVRFDSLINYLLCYCMSEYKFCIGL